MSNSYPCMGPLGQQPQASLQQQQCYPAAGWEGIPPVGSQPYAPPVPGTLQHVAPMHSQQQVAAAGLSPCPPTQQQYQTSSHEPDATMLWPGQQQQQQQFNEQAGPDGSRGLGSSLACAAHKVHKVELAMHHLSHPAQGVKYHTVDKLKRKVKAKANGAVNKLIDKVLP